MGKIAPVEWAVDDVDEDGDVVIFPADVENWEDDDDDRRLRRLEEIGGDERQIQMAEIISTIEEEVEIDEELDEEEESDGEVEYSEYEEEEFNSEGEEGLGGQEMALEEFRKRKLEEERKRETDRIIREVLEAIRKEEEIEKGIMMDNEKIIVDDDDEEEEELALYEYEAWKAREILRSKMDKYLRLRAKGTQ